MLALQRKEDDLSFRFLRIKKAREGIAPGPRFQQKHSPHSCRGMRVGLRFGDRAVGSEIIFFFICWFLHPKETPLTRMRCAKETRGFQSWEGIKYSLKKMRKWVEERRGWSHRAAPDRRLWESHAESGMLGSGLRGEVMVA